MRNLEEAKAFFEKDYFAMGCGIQIDEVGEGTSKCSFEIETRHLNGGGIVQGGAIFTLADFAFAVAANTGEIGRASCRERVYVLV